LQLFRQIRNGINFEHCSLGKRDLMSIKLKLVKESMWDPTDIGNEASYELSTGTMTFDL